MDSPGEKGQTTVRLSIRLSVQDHDAENLAFSGLSMQQAVETLVRQLPQRILRATEKGSAKLAAAEQARILEERAAEFTKLGAYRAFDRASRGRIVADAGRS